MTNVSDNAEKNNTYTFTVTRGTEDAKGNYETITANVGTLTIDPKKVTITAKDANKAYDGDPLTQPEFTASALEEGDTHTFTVVMTEDSTITDVGTQPNVIATVDGVAVTTGTATAVGNYMVTTANGTLTITKDTAALVITSASNSWTYDSKLHKDETYTVTYGGETVAAGEDGKTFTLPNGDVVTITATAAGVTNVSDNAEKNNTYTFTVTRGTADTKGNYETITANVGTLTIDPKAVTITAKDNSKTYDAKPLTQPEFTATTLETGDTHTFTVVMTEDSTITNVGTQPNVIATVDGVAVTTGVATAVGNYMVTTVNGTLRIDPKAVTITAEDANKAYDGTALVQPLFKASDLEATDDHVFTVVMTADSTITDVGTQPNVIATVDGVAVTTGVATAVGNYLVTTANGTLTITQDEAELVIKSADGNWTYDGQLHKNETYTVTYKGETVTADSTGKVFILPNNDILTITATASGVTNVTDNAADNNTYTYVVKRGETVTTANYKNIVANVGDLVINPRAVRITVANDDKVYGDNDPAFVNAVMSGQVTGELTDIDLTVRRTNTDETVGTYDGVLAISKTKAELEVAYTNYTFTVGTGNFTITQAPLKITVIDQSYVYNGSPQGEDDTVYKDGFNSKVTVEGLKGEDELTSITLDGQETDAGEYANKIVASEAAVGNATGNYTITYVPGKLTITSAPIGPDDPDKRFVVTGPEDTVYNAEEQRQPVTVKDTKTGKDLVEGTDVTITYSEDVTNVGEVTVTITGIGNYSGTIVKTYNITPAPLTITVLPQTYEYNGSPQGENKATYTADLDEKVIVEGLQGEDALTSITLNGQETDAATYTGKLVASDAEIGEATNNYAVKYVPGDLTITKATIVPEDPEDPEDPVVKRFKVEGPEDTMYNGKEQKQPVEITDNATGKTLVEGKDCTVTYSNDVIHVGEVTVTITGIGNYEGTITRTYNITKRPITLTSDSAKKAYDGEALTAEHVTIGGEGLAETDDIKFSDFASRTLVGKSDNTFEYEFVPAEAKKNVFVRLLGALGLADDAFAHEENDIEKNYAVTVVYGELEITDDVTPENHEKVVHKTHAGEDGTVQTYKADDIIEYTISVTNIYEDAKTITITEQNGVELEGSADGKVVFENVPAGETVTVNATYRVTETDVLNGSFTNTVEASFEGEKTHTDDDIVDTFAHMTVTKKVTNTPADGKVFRNGETIKYEITVLNDGTQDMTKVIVKDALTGDEWTVDTLKAGESKTFKAQYVITAKDAAAGSVTNVATAEGTDPDGDNTPGKPGDVTTKTDKAPEPTIPKTGDTTPIMGYSFMLTASLFGLILLFRRKKEEE